jgi:hypothetical protein
VTITESACDALKVHPARPFFTIAVLIFYLCVGNCSLSVIARASEDVQFGDPDVADPAPPSAVGASQPPSPLHFSGSDATAIETTADHERDSASAVPGRGELGERQFADWSQQRRWPPRGMMPPPVVVQPRPWPPLGFGPSPRRSLAEILRKHDADQDGKLTLTEFPEAWRSIFGAIDENENGLASRGELLQFQSLVQSDQEGVEALRPLLNEETVADDQIDRIHAVLEQRRITEISNLAQVRAVRRAGWLKYLFTVGAMMITVISFGHLISSPPPTGRRWTHRNVSRDATKAIIYSLVFICLLSCIDLVWTQMRAETTHFTEMNPLGSQLLLDGGSPMLFKLGTLAVSIALLFRLRRFIGAQVASWWMCLICTLLAFRWILLDSAMLS